MSHRVVLFGYIPTGWVFVKRSICARFSAIVSNNTAGIFTFVKILRSCTSPPPPAQTKSITSTSTSCMINTVTAFIMTVIFIVMTNCLMTIVILVIIAVGITLSITASFVFFSKCAILVPKKEGNINKYHVTFCDSVRPVNIKYISTGLRLSTTPLIKKYYQNSDREQPICFNDIQNSIFDNKVYNKDPR